MESSLTKGAIAGIPPIREGFFSRLFLVPKKGGTFRPVIDLSFLDKFAENSHFQMESIHCLKSKRRLYDHTRSERCLFVSPSPQGLTKVTSIPLEKHVLRLPRPLFWLKYCTKDLHQTFKTRRSICSQMRVSYFLLHRHFKE